MGQFLNPCLREGRTRFVFN